MKSHPTKFEFSPEIAQMGALQKLQNSNSYKLSILSDIWRATILPFSSSKYFYSWERLLN